eukprot:5077139-Prymnesium_polylepis.2
MNGEQRRLVHGASLAECRSEHRRERKRGCIRLQKGAACCAALQQPRGIQQAAPVARSDRPSGKNGDEQIELRVRFDARVAPVIASLHARGRPEDIFERRQRDSVVQDRVGGH